MDGTQFSENSPGNLISIRVNDESDWSFVPDALPSSFELKANNWPLLVQAKEELARLDGVGRHLPNQELLLRPLQQREALTSSGLEGTFATPEQLILYGMDPRDPSSDKDPVNSWKEVFNYGKALAQGQQQLDEGYPFSLMLIRQMHQSLLSGVRGQDKAPGKFRETQVFIGSTRRFVPPPPIEVPRCLGELEKYFSEESSVDSLVRCFLVHYQFETIHPFIDGNGRVGRLLLSLMIYKWCRLHHPWLYLSPFFERYKDEYIDCLFKVSAKGDMNGWVEFCLRATIEQSKDSIYRIDKLVELKQVFQDKVHSSGGSVRLHSIVENLFAEPIVKVSDLAKVFGVSYPTANTDVKKLEKMKILQPLEGFYPKTHYSPEIMNIAYRKVDS